MPYGAAAQSKPAAPSDRGVRELGGNSSSIAVGESMCMIVQGGRVACTQANLDERRYHGRVEGSIPENAPSKTIPKAAAWEAVAGLQDTVALTAGFRFFCALSKKGEVRCWGQSPTNQWGSRPSVTLFGNGKKERYSVPQPVNGLSGPVTAFSAEMAGLCVRLATGNIRCRSPFSKDINWRELGLRPEQVRSYVGRENGRCFLSLSGVLKCLLFNEEGSATWSSRDLGPVQLFGFSGGGETLEGVAALTRGGQLRLCHNLGVEGKADCPQVANTPANVVEIHKRCLRTRRGEVYCWSDPADRSQPSGEPLTVLRMDLPEAAIALSAGIGDPCARLVSGKVACFRWRSPIISKLVPGAVIFAAPALPAAAARPGPG